MGEWSYAQDVVLIEALTQREMDVLSYLAKGLSSREIAKAMTLALSTVNWYIQQIYTKLGVNHRQDALRRARELGLLNAPSANEQASQPPDILTRHNLPSQLSSFIGREKEIADARTLLSQTRLLTLSGVGGTGKTRLALMVTEQVLGEFEHGAWLVDLAPLHDPALIPSTVAALFGLSHETGRPLQDKLNDYFRSKRLLLVLDNCEHLVQEAAQFAADVLRAAPGVKILATSREVLGIAGEMVYRVPPLEIPDPLHMPPIQSLAQFDAVWLFIERASATQSFFSLTEQNGPAIARICQRLDGIPLALELAAARVKVLSPEQIAARLEDCFSLLTEGKRAALPHHQTITALIDWSYNLLSEPERLLFRRLSVFHGGWTVEAAAALHLGGNQADIEVVDGLAGLVNKSLIHSTKSADGTNRFTMLETLRQYAYDKLQESGETAEIRDRHLRYFVSFAEAMGKKLLTPAYLEALEQLDAEIGNHRAALDWALSPSRPARLPMGLRLADALADYWYHRSLFQESYDWLSKALSIPMESDSLLSLRARAYQRAGDFSVASIATVTRYRQESVALYRKSGDKNGLAHALISYGMLLADTMPAVPHPIDSPTGITLLEEGSAILERLGDPSSLGDACYARSLIALARRDPQTQRAMLEKSLACFEQAGYILACEELKAELAVFALHRNEFETTGKLLEQCREFFRNMNSKIPLAMTLARLGELAYRQENFAQAETWFQQAREIFHDIGQLEGIIWTTRMKACVVLRQGQASRARQLFLESQALGRSLYIRDQLGDPGGDLAFVLWTGITAESLGQSAVAARFLGAVEAILESFFKGLDPWDHWEYDRVEGKLRTELDDTALRAAWDAGRNLSLDQALSEALVYI
jgi:predicted ATPase/DNA-binding CsgD family transcriptional regulator